MNDPIDPQITPDTNTQADFNGNLGYQEVSGNGRTPFEDFLDMVKGEKEAIAIAIRSVLLKILPSISSPSLLEIAAGTGKITSYYIDLFTRTTLIEPSEHFCGILREAFPSAKIITDTFEGYVSNPKLDGNNYDVLAISHAFQYIQRPLEYLQKMLDLRNPGGKLIITMSDMSDKPSQYTALISSFQQFGHSQGEFNVENVREYLTATGQEFQQHNIETKFVCPTIDDFFKVLPIVMNIDDSTLSKSQRDEIEAYLIPFHTERGIVLTVGHTILVV